MLKDHRPAMATMYEEGAPLRLVAERFGCSTSTVYTHLRAHGVKTRPVGQRNAFTDPWCRAVDALTEQVVARRYREGAVLNELVEEFGIGRKAVVNALRRQGVVMRSPSDAARHVQMVKDERLGPRVKSRHGNAQGYVVAILSRNHLRLGMASKTRGVLEHRLVMAESLGRDLTRSETVHHVNGVRDDNRLENLQMRQGKHGNGQRFVCADCGSHNVIAAEFSTT